MDEVDLGVGLEDVLEAAVGLAEDADGVVGVVGLGDGEIALELVAELGAGGAEEEGGVSLRRGIM